jgi:prepilin-type N-terminal cleavage/methylation domain-containing protein
VIRRSQSGFTLVELMIALLISTLLVGMILAIFGRISLAYRGQEQVTTLQQELSSARVVIDFDAKQAGLALSSGFKIAADGTTTHGVLHSPVVITDSSTAPDQVAFFYADPSEQAAVTASAWPASLTFDDPSTFHANDLVVLSTPSTSTTNPLAPNVDANLTTFDACVLQIATISGTVVTFSQTGSWGVAGNTHCDGGATYSPALNTAANGTMMYKFVAHAYRVDTGSAVAANGQLEMSPTGNLVPALNDWVIEGFGFTDLQVATYFFDNDAIDTPDPDSDPKRDWWTTTQQDTYTKGFYKDTAGGIAVPPIQMSISLVARTDKDVEGITTAQTPVLEDPLNISNNTVGDRASFALPAVTGAACDATCVSMNSGARVYRYTTFTTDLRNLGVGR